MKKYISLFITIFIIQQLLLGQENDNIKADVFMTKKQLQTAQMDITFIPEFIKIPNNFIFLSSEQNLYILGREGLMKILIYSDVNSFTLSSMGEFYFIQGDVLKKLNEPTNELIEVTNLPKPNMRISTGENALYIFDNEKISNSNNYSIYKLFSNNDYIKIIDVPSIINSVVEVENYVLFSTENKLYAVDIENKAVKEIAALHNENDKIISVNWDNTNNALYFSSEQAIFRMKEGKVDCVNDQFSGMLQCDDVGLVIFNPKEQFVVRIHNSALFSSSSITSTTPKSNTQPNETKPALTKNGEQKITYTEPTTLIPVFGEQFEAKEGDIFEGEMKDGKIVQGKVIRNGETVKMFLNKRNQ